MQGNVDAFKKCFYVHVHPRASEQRASSACLCVVGASVAGRGSMCWGWECGNGNVEIGMWKWECAGLSFCMQRSCSWPGGEAAAALLGATAA